MAKIGITVSADKKSISKVNHTVNDALKNEYNEYLRTWNNSTFKCNMFFHWHFPWFYSKIASDILRLLLPFLCWAAYLLYCLMWLGKNLPTLTNYCTSQKAKILHMKILLYIGFLLLQTNLNYILCTI